MKNAKNTLAIVYLATFFYAFHYAITLYIESSFLGKFLSTESVGLMFTVAALASILLIFNLPPILRKVGNYRVLITAVILEIAALFSLAVVSSWEFIVFFFVLHQILLNTIYFSLTIFLESLSKDESTGGIRGVFFTIVNVAILAGPIVTGNILDDDSYKSAFMVAGVIAIPILFLIGRNLRNFNDPDYTTASFAGTIGAIVREKNMRYIFTIQFLLQFFYGVMVIYTPIYLHTRLGIDMADILGIIMPIALIPFVIFPYIIGNLADKKFGEKEMLFFGFVVIGAATISISFIHSTAVAVWAGALFVTRVGATFIETMAESYFFKHVDAGGAHVISFFRNMTSFSYLFSPVVASAFLSLFDYRYIFAALGAIMLLGLRYSLMLKDTK